MCVREYVHQIDRWFDRWVDGWKEREREGIINVYIHVINNFMSFKLGVRSHKFGYAFPIVRSVCPMLMYFENSMFKDFTFHVLLSCCIRAIYFFCLCRCSHFFSVFCVLPFILHFLNGNIFYILILYSIS